MKRILAIAAALAGLLAYPAHAGSFRWTRAESPHFIVYSNTTDAYTREFVERLEIFDTQADKLYSQFGDSELPEHGKHVFYYMNNVGDFNVVRRDSATDSYWSFSPYINCPFEDTRNFGVSMGEKLQKTSSEYLNLDLAYTYFAYARLKGIKYFSATPSPWLNLGLKYYLMTMFVKGDKLIVGQLLPELATEANFANAKFIPLSQIVANSYPKDSDGTLVNVESWFLTHWFVTSAENRRKLTDYMTRTRNGEEPVKAFVAATGQQPDDLLPVLKGYFRDGVPVLTYAYTPAPATDITLTQLPDYSQPLPLMAAAMWGCSGPYYGKALLEHARTVAAAFPDDPLAQGTRLTGEVLFGDLTKREPQSQLAVLEAQAAAHPDDTTTLTLLGRLHLRMAEEGPSAAAHMEYAAARAAFGKAYQADPSSPAILALFSRARADLPGYPDDQAVQAMNLAQSYSADVYDLYVAELAVRRGDDDGALKALVDWHPERMNNNRYKPRVTAIINALKAGKPAADVLPLITTYEKMWFDGQN